MYRYIITGGRNNTDSAHIRAVLAGCVRAAVVCDTAAIFYVGDCKTGVDKITRDFLQQHGCAYNVYAAEWHKYGRFAGPRRNKMMINTAVSNTDDTIICVAFAGGRGTASCIRYARDAGVRVLEY